jgi:hypothetical protein
MHKVPPSLTIAVFLIVSLATFFWMAIDGELLSAPAGEMRDDIYFENIAFHLAQGEGIKLDFTNKAWRRPYELANDKKQYDWMLDLQARGTTTSRSPGFPILVAGLYRVFGRQFLPVRILNAALLAAAITILLVTVFRLFGKLTATFALVTFSLDGFVLKTAGQFMTEATGTAIVCLIFASCLRLTCSGLRSDENPNSDALSWGWLGLGFLFGCGSLVRANLNAWLPMIAIGFLIWIGWRAWHRLNWRLWLTHGVLFGLGVLLIAGPFWCRNCNVTGAFTPLGTSGSFGLSGGYCDRAYNDFGNWSLADSVESQHKTMAKPVFFDLSLAKQEHWMGKDSANLAMNWISKNRDKLPALIGMKAISHLGFYRQPLAIQIMNGLLFFGALLGCVLAWRWLGFWFAVFLGLSLATTCVAWPHFGRYSIPLRPLVHVACAVGTVRFWSLQLSRGKQGSNEL